MTYSDITRNIDDDDEVFETPAFVVIVAIMIINLCLAAFCYSRKKQVEAHQSIPDYAPLTSERETGGASPNLSPFETPVKQDEVQCDRPQNPVYTNPKSTAVPEYESHAQRIQVQKTAPVGDKEVEMQVLDIQKSESETVQTIGDDTGRV